MCFCCFVQCTESGTMSGGGGRPRGGLMRLGNAAPRVAAADAQAAAKELAAAEKALQQAESELRQARSNRSAPNAQWAWKAHTAPDCSHRLWRQAASSVVHVDACFSDSGDMPGSAAVLLKLHPCRTTVGCVWVTMAPSSCCYLLLQLSFIIPMALTYMSTSPHLCLQGCC